MKLNIDKILINDILHKINYKQKELIIKSHYSKEILNDILIKEEAVMSFVIKMIVEKVAFKSWVSNSVDLDITYIKKSFLYAAFVSSYEMKPKDIEQLKSKRMRLYLSLDSHPVMIGDDLVLFNKPTDSERRCGELIRANIVSRLRILESNS